VRKGGDYTGFNTSLQALFNSRMLKKWEFEAAYEWMDMLKLPEEVIMLMVQYCIDVKNTDVSFKYMAKVAIDWAESNILSVEAAEEYISEYQARYSGAARVLGHLGIKNRTPNKEEVNLYDKWVKEYGYTIDTILYACRETTCITNPNMRYLDKVLTNMHSVGVVEKKRVTEYIKLKDAHGLRVKAILGELGLKDMQIPMEYYHNYDKWVKDGFRADTLTLAARRSATAEKSDWETLCATVKEYKANGLMTPAAVRAHYATDKKQPFTQKKTNAHYSGQRKDDYTDIFVDLENN
jgi:DnaD/phage-associated family protein